MEAIVSKWNWNAVKEGGMTKLELIRPENLHNLFGDDPEKYILRISIKEIPANPNNCPWWCPHCEAWISAQCVTYQETHDKRSGGCGGQVMARCEIEIG